MKILLDRAGKRFNREWIFRNAGFEFLSGKSYAITGPNGSGKSTFLQCIGGMLHLNEGTVSFEHNKKKLTSESIYKEISFCAPYLDLIEEMTLIEFLQFHSAFKPFLPGFNIEKTIEAVQLSDAAQKQIRNYSSGMKQRVKLAQALLFDTAVVLLDEPCSNLDLRGIDLYKTLIKQHTIERIVLVCSNDEIEYSFCDQVIPITNFK